MRIGIDARFYSGSFTGIGRYVYELIDNLLKLDRRNEYVLFFNSPEFEKFTAPRKGVTKILADSPHYSFKEQFHFWRILQKANLDLMHFTHFNAPILYRRPSIVTIHDLTLNLHPGKKMAGAIHRLAYTLTIQSIIKRSKRVIAPSEHTRQDIVKHFNIEPDKIAVIHEGVNPSFHKISDENIVNDFLAKTGLTKPYILYTGVWRSHKNLVNLIKAFAILKHTHHFPGWLVITGKEDPWYPEVKQTVANENLEGCVRFTGLVPDEDLVLLYNSASIFVLPSFYEGFGLPALEAFACGVPACVSKTSSLPEVCGTAAEYFDPNDPNDMASKIALVYNDDTKKADLISRGFERIKDFSWSKMAEQTLDLYNQTLNFKL
ncbi:glycosyltransferase family 4 protein [Candidatus Peregrinibacteria bacterium]|nr:glycosyltransferase family 4 protein [Candidatus Peregrinibacteria bacterium]